MTRRRSRRLSEAGGTWLPKALPPFASSWDEIQRAVARNSIQRGAFILKSLAALSFDAIVARVQEEANQYDREMWAERADDLAMDEVALRALDRWPLPYPLYFCTPELLQAAPTLVLYYRNVAMLSQKVMGGLGLPTTRYELGATLPPERALALARHFNRIASGLIRATHISPTRHLELAYTNLGDSFGGAWRNEVGRLAYSELLTPLLLHLHGLGMLEGFSYKLKGRILQEEEQEASSSSQVHHQRVGHGDDLAQRLAELNEQRVIYREVQLSNGRRLEVNRQLTWLDGTGTAHKIGPDLSAVSHDAHSMFWSAELKGGADPAGSDEHWKTATRAFERIIEASQLTGRELPALSFLATILVDRVAREAALWLEQGKLVSVHNLTQMADDPQKQRLFIEEVTAFLSEPPPAKH